MKAAKNKVLYFGGLLLSLVLACAVSVAVIQIFLPKAIVAWDEAANMVWGYKIYDALRNHEWRTAGELSGAQVYYPPLQSWFIGITSLITGFSIPIVRITNLLWLLVIAPLIFHLGYSLRKNRSGVIVGLVASVLFLASPMTLALSSVALKEIMGTALTLASFISYRHMEEKNRLRDAVVAGLLVLALFYFKYNYALFLCAGYAVLSAVNVLSKEYKNYRPMLVFWTISFLGSGFWVFLQGQRLITEFVWGQIPQTVGIGTWVDKLLFYPRSVIIVYSPNAGIGLLMIGIFFCSFVWFRNKTIRALWVVILVYFSILGLYSDNLHERYVFPVMPFLYLLTSYFIVHIFRLLQRIHTAYTFPIMVGLCVGLTAMTAYYILRLPTLVYSVGAHTLRFPIFNQPDYRDTLFDFNPAHWTQIPPAPGAQNPGDVIAYVLGTVGSMGTFTVIGDSNELSPKYWELSSLLSAKKYMRAPFFKAQYIVGITILPGSRFYTRDYLLFNAQSEKALYDIIARNGYTFMNDKLFFDLNIHVSIYKNDNVITGSE